MLWIAQALRRYLTSGAAAQLIAPLRLAVGSSRCCGIGEAAAAAFAPPSCLEVGLGAAGVGCGVQFLVQQVQ